MRPALPLQVQSIESAGKLVVCEERYQNCRQTAFRGLEQHLATVRRLSAAERLARIDSVRTESH